MPSLPRGGGHSRPVQASHKLKSKALHCGRMLVKPQPQPNDHTPPMCLLFVLVVLVLFSCCSRRGMSARCSWFLRTHVAQLGPFLVVLVPGSPGSRFLVLLSFEWSTNARLFFRYFECAQTLSQHVQERWQACARSLCSKSHLSCHAQSVARRWLAR